MDLKDVKAWLNRGRDLQKLIDVIADEKAELLCRLIYKAGKYGGERVQTSKINHNEKSLAQYIDYAVEVDNLMTELFKIKKELLIAIRSVPDHTLRVLLFRRYIRFETWEWIADEMNRSYVHVVHRLHPQALNTVKIILEKN